MSPEGAIGCSFLHSPFPTHLIGKKFTLHTDYGCLKWLSNFKHPEGQIAHWLNGLQEYDCDIVHHKRCQHLNADSLSRLPCKQCVRQSDETTGTEIAFIQTVIGGMSLTDIRQSQLDGGSNGFTLRAIESNKKPDANQLQQHSGLGVRRKR